MLAKLIAITPRGLGRKYALGHQCVLGRHPDCDIQVVDGLVSKRHAQITCQNEAHWLEDLQSLNGVFVDGQRLEHPHRLQPNETFGVGGFTFVYEPTLEVLPDADTDRVVLLLDDQNTQIARQTARSLDAPALHEANHSALVDAALDALAEPEASSRALHRVLDVVRAEVPHDTAAVLAVTPEEGGQELEVVHLCGGENGVAVSKSLAAKVIETGQALCVEGLAFAGPAASRHVLGDDGAVRAVLAAPLRLDQRLLGILWIARSGSGSYTPEQVATLGILAPFVATALLRKQRSEPITRRLAPQGPAQPTTELEGTSPATQELAALVARVAPMPSSVLITGETGAGKEVVARRLHELGPGPDQAFVAVNCGALPESLAESELFGYERGAFSGAQKRTPGKLELACGGTLFLDEIGELSLTLQVKLLRALEQRQFYRLGGVKPVEVQFRLVAATHRDLQAMCRDRSFREDLLFRINVMPLQVLPLRDRPEDIEPLARLFVQQLSRDLNRPIHTVAPEVFTRLADYAWPGNARELRNVIERALILCDGPSLDARHLVIPTNRTAPVDLEADVKTRDGMPLAQQVAELERHSITRALRRARGRKAAAATALSISRPTLDKKIRAYGIDLFAEETSTETPHGSS